MELIRTLKFNIEVEVTIRIPQDLPQAQDVSDPRVPLKKSKKGKQDDFAKFLNDETSRLRELFVADCDDDDHDDYEDFFDTDASRSLVKNTLKMIWEDRREVNVLRKDVLRLKQMKELQKKYDEYKRELQKLRSSFETGPRTRRNIKSTYLKLREHKNNMKKLKRDVDAVSKRLANFREGFPNWTDKTLKNLEQIHASFVSRGDNIVGDFQRLLLKRRYSAIKTNLAEVESFFIKL